MTKSLLIVFFTVIIISSGFPGSSRAAGDPLKMDGYTHYGIPIEDIRKLIRYEDFAGVIVFSGRLSDDLPGKYVTIFFDEFVRQMQQALNQREEMPLYTLRVEVANCRYGKTGYCGREKLTGIIITSYINSKKDREISLSRDEATHPGKYVETARRAALHLIGDR